LLPCSATPRLVACNKMTSSGSGLRYRQSKSPVFASSAITWFPGVATNMTPLLTIGGAWWPLVTPVEKLHTGCSRVTLPRVICSSGL
jgi:hypothetical protein